MATVRELVVSANVSNCGVKYQNYVILKNFNTRMFFKTYKKIKYSYLIQLKHLWLNLLPN